jgi:C1A family cysteine protease
MENGPVMAAICADYLQGYTSGVLNVTNCPTAINHAIAIVGWGSQNGINYWIVKNSWGTGWGENGYFRIIRGKNMCGINRYYYYPLMTNAVPFSKTN